MSELTTPALIGLCLALVGAAALGYGAVTAWRRLQRSPRMVLRRIAHQRLTDVVLPDGVEGEIHIDHLVLTDRGLLVLELRNASGALFGAESMDEWRVIDGVRRFTFRNPLPALAARLHAVRLLAGEVPVEGRIAFVGTVHFAAGRPPGTATLAEVGTDFQRGGEVAEASPAGEAEWLETWRRIREAAGRSG